MGEQFRKLVRKASAGGTFGFRNITSPSNRLVDDHITAPHIITDTSTDPSPTDDEINAPPRARAIRAIPFSDLQEKPEAKAHATTPQEVITIDPIHGLTRSITGADHSVPIFNGMSTDPKDCLIELDDDSMERLADVRVYLAHVGSTLNGESRYMASMHLPLDEARAYDDEMVRKGRLHLKACRERGIGFYLNKDRDFASYGQAKGLWYRMPALGIVYDLVHGSLEAQEDEGFFQTPDYRLKRYNDGGEVILTNIRIPILWAEFKTHDFKPATVKWDDLVGNYYVNYSPVLQIIYGSGWEELMLGFGLFDGVRGTVSPTGIEAMIRRDWKDHCPPDSDAEGPCPKMLELTNGGKAKHFFRDDKREPKAKKRFGKKKR